MITTTQVYIVGAGAIGKTLAVLLHGNNKNVTLVRASTNHQPTPTETISLTMPDQSIKEASIPVRPLSSFAELNGIIVLTNKSFGNKQLAKTLKEKANASPIVLLQNGLGVEQPFLDEQLSGIYRCVLFATSQITSSDSTSSAITFKPVSSSPIGVIKGNDATLQAVVDQLNSPNFPFRSVPDIQPIIWKKAINNSVFNSICPLLDVDNGVFHRDPAALAIAKRVIAECLVVAEGQGIHLDPDEVLESLLMISRFADGQLISTLQDIKKNRRTEIETLNFEIVRLAQIMGKTAAVQETSLLGELTLLKSNLSMAAAPNPLTT